jgi:hypothetical protein
MVSSICLGLSRSNAQTKRQREKGFSEAPRAKLCRSVTPAFAKASARSPFASSPRQAAGHARQGE